MLDPRTVVEMGDRGMAKYGIIRMQKFNKEAIYRDPETQPTRRRESKNKDIDSNRTMLNYDFVNEDKIKYHEEIKEDDGHPCEKKNSE